MKPVRAEFIRPNRPTRKQWQFALALATLLAAAVAGLGWQYGKLEVLKQLNTQSLLAQQASKAPGSVSPQFAVAPPYLESALELQEERTLPWPSALAALENSAIVGVTPTAIELQLKEHALRVELAVSDPQSLLDYVDALNAGTAPQTPEAWHWGIRQIQRTPNGGQTAVLIGVWQQPTAR